MTEDRKPRLERRTGVRISPKGSLVVTATAAALVAGWTRSGRVINLSATGALLEAGDEAAQIGEAVAIELRLDGPRRAWIQLTGRVTRTAATGLAVAFDAVSADYALLISEVSNASRTNDRWLSVVLVDATAPRRTAMADAFRAAGCSVLEFATSHGAIHELGESHFEPDLIAIADSLPEDVSDDLRRFVEADHPHVKLVRIGDDTIEPVGLAHWLSTANPNDDLVARIRTVLGRPAHAVHTS